MKKIQKKYLALILVMCLIINVIQPWQFVRASSVVRVGSLTEIKNALLNNDDIVLDSDIYFSDYTFEDMSWVYGRIGIFQDEILKATYCVEDGEYYEDYQSEITIDFDFGINIDEWKQPDEYSGTIDGNGHSIIGYCPYKDKEGKTVSSGFFNTVTGEISNLTFKNCFLYTNDICPEVSVVCHELKGTANNVKVEDSCVVVGSEKMGSYTKRGAGMFLDIEGTVSNCSVNVDIIGNYSSYVGGIACAIYGDGQICNSSFSGSIEVKSKCVAGIVATKDYSEGSVIIDNCRNEGYIHTEGYNSVASGIVGRVSDYGEVTINNCTNNSSIDGIKPAGIVGYIDNKYREGVITISDCSNTGTVSAIGGDSEGKSIAGGILAGDYEESEEYSNTLVSIVKCTNKGGIKAYKIAGGIVGSIYGKTACYNIISCNNEGEVCCNSVTNSCSAGLVGYCGLNSYVRVFNSINKGKINNDSGGSVAGLVATKTEIAGLMADNCVNMGDCYKGGEAISKKDGLGLFGELIHNNIYNCYEVERTETKISLIYNCFEVERTETEINISLLEKDLNDKMSCTSVDVGIKDLCNRLNVWIRDCNHNISKEYLSTWICKDVLYEDKDIMFGEADWESVMSLPELTTSQTPSYVPMPTKNPDNPKVTPGDKFESIYIPTATPEPTPNPTLKPTPKPTLKPTPKPTPSSSVDLPNQVESPNPTPVKPEDTPVPIENVDNKNADYVLVTEAPVGVDNSNISNYKPVLVSIKDSGSFTIKWSEIPTAKGYILYRAKTKKGVYKKIKTFKGTRNSFVENNIAMGKVYYYKVKAYSTSSGKTTYSQWSEPVKVSKIMQKPMLSLKKAKTSTGDKYIRLSVKKCDGPYVDVYVGIKKNKLIKIKLPVNNWKKMNSTFNFRYSSGGRRMFFRIRSYGRYNGKKVKSPYSDIKSIVL